jgi:hypothetical protein
MKTRHGSFRFDMYRRQIGRRPKWAIRDRDEAATGLAMSLLHPKGEMKSGIGIYRDETQRIDRVSDA